MIELLRKTRGIGIALVVLAISAGAVFAAAPRFAPVSNTAEATETTSETTSDTSTTTVDEDGDEDEDADTTETTTETSETSDGTDANHTHGDWVSEAAQGDTPEGFDNHGQYVRCVAHADTAAEGYTLPLTPADCGYVTTTTTDTTTTTALGAQGKGKSDMAKGHAGKSKPKHGKHGG